MDKKQLQEKTVKELREIASDIESINGEWEMKKENLVEAIVAAQPKKEESKEPKKEAKPGEQSLEPKKVGTEAGYKNPSITDLRFAYTKKQYQKLIEAYKEQNPEKYKMKKEGLERKLNSL